MRYLFSQLFELLETDRKARKMSEIIFLQGTTEILPHASFLTHKLALIVKQQVLIMLRTAKEMRKIARDDVATKMVAEIVNATTLICDAKVIQGSTDSVSFKNTHSL